MMIVHFVRCRRVWVRFLEKRTHTYLELCSMGRTLKRRRADILGCFARRHAYYHKGRPATYKQYDMTYRPPMTSLDNNIITQIS